MAWKILVAFCAALVALVIVALAEGASAARELNLPELAAVLGGALAGVVIPSRARAKRDPS